MKKLSILLLMFLILSLALSFCGCLRPVLHGTYVFTTQEFVYDTSIDGMSYVWVSRTYVFDNGTVTYEEYNVSQSKVIQPLRKGVFHVDGSTLTIQFDDTVQPVELQVKIRSNHAYIDGQKYKKQ